MYTREDTIVKLRETGVLTEKGLDLSVLADGQRFGDDQCEITNLLLMQQCLAIVWELARRYNTTYRIRSDGHFMFESRSAWNAEAKWFALAIMRDWSGHELSWLGEINAPTLRDAPKREGIDNKLHSGRLSWLNKDAAYNVQLRVFYQIERDYLCDALDLDPFDSLRKIMAPTAINIERFKYVPFTHPTKPITIGPTVFIERYGYNKEDGDDVTQRPESRKADVIYRPDSPAENVTFRPESPEQIAGYFHELGMEREKHRARVNQYDWWKFLLESKAKPVDCAALEEGLDPLKLYTHSTVVPEEMEALERNFGVRVYTAEDYKKPCAFLALEQDRGENGSDSDSDSDSTSDSFDDGRVWSPSWVVHCSTARVPSKAKTGYSTPPSPVGMVTLSPPLSPSQPHEEISSGLINTVSHSFQQLQKVLSLPGPLQTPSQPATKPNEVQIPSTPEDEQSKGPPLPPADPSETPARPSSQLPSQPHESQTSSLTGLTLFNALQPLKDEESGRGSLLPAAGPPQMSSQRHLFKKASRRPRPQAGVGSYLKKKISNIERRLDRLSLKSPRERPDRTRTDASEFESESQSSQASSSSWCWILPEEDEQSC